MCRDIHQLRASGGAGLARRPGCLQGLRALPLQDERLRKVAPPPLKDKKSDLADSPVAGDNVTASTGDRSNRKGGRRTQLPVKRPLTKRTRADAPCGRASKVSRLQSIASSTLDDTVKEINKIDARCSIPRYGFEPFPTPDVFKLAAAIRSRHAISQLFDLIKRQRDMNVDRPEPTTQTDDDRLRRCVRGIDAGEGHVGLKQLRTRLKKWIPTQSQTPKTMANLLVRVEANRKAQTTHQSSTKMQPLGTLRILATKKEARTRMVVVRRSR